MSAASGAWGGNHERKRSAIATVSAAVSGRSRGLPGAVLRIDPDDSHTDLSNAYCIAFDTVDPAELEGRSGLPIWALMLISAALVSCWDWNHASSVQQRYVTPVARNGFVDALEAIRPGADLAGFPARYVIALLRDARGLVPPQDGVAAARLSRTIERVAQLHQDACDGCAPDDASWSAARGEAVAATDAANSTVGRVIAKFVEAVAWPMDSLVAELPDMVSEFLSDLVSAEQEVGYTVEMRDRFDRNSRAVAAILNEAKSSSPLDVEWIKARIAEHPDVQAFGAPEFQDQLIALARVVCDRHGPRAYRLLLDTLKGL